MHVVAMFSEGLQVAALTDMMIELKKRNYIGAFEPKVMKDLSHLVAPTALLMVRSMAVASTLALSTSTSTRCDALQSASDDGIGAVHEGKDSIHVRSRHTSQCCTERGSEVFKW